MIGRRAAPLDGPVLVVGGGVMGAGIAEVCLRAQLEVVLVEIARGREEAARSTSRGPWTGRWHEAGWTRRRPPHA